MSTSASVVIDGYDVLAETGRCRFPDRVLAGRRLNRGTAVVAAGGTPHAEARELKREYARQVVTSTLTPDCPVVDLSYPVAGMFADSPAGVYLDLYQGVAQRLFDDQHPRLTATIEALVSHGLAFRREIATDDFLTIGRPLGGLRAPRELAALVNGLTSAAFPGMGECRTFFSNSGAEAGEAAIKLAQLHCYRRLVARHGPALLERLMEDLGIARDRGFDDEPGPPDDPLYADYPFVVIGCDGAFHGRTLGVLALTRSRKAQQLAFGKPRWRRHIPFNGRVQDLADLLDTRPLPAILDAPGGAAAVFASGRVPAELAALFAIECYQGEGGYRLADRAWLRAVAALCRQHGILLGLDEVQSFGRTGALYAGERYGLVPDLVWVAKAAVVGLTVVRAALADEAHVGWHSNTFGGGKLFDVNLAYTVIDTLAGWQEPLFEGRGYLENSRIKGEYVRMRLAELCAQHADVFPAFSGLGGMWGLTVRHRDEVIATGWRQGAKLIGCGRRGALSRLRIVLLTDVLTREIDEMIRVLERTFAAVSVAHADDPHALDEDVDAPA
ncbi:MAG TPA: aminotransferase class III-fold pyridoxal phosphate-dependent enzyme [Planctomycetota bacterium]|nr:aminotransferase class III-fold pyridoxal phosphate-dependent enzyme [Planctomycetota bacterium]